MNINAKRIEELGGFMVLEIELNTPEIPEVDGQTVIAYLFNSTGVARFENYYLYLGYPPVSDVQDDEQKRRIINQYRFGNRLPDDFKVTIDDVAMYFGEVDMIDEDIYRAVLVSNLKIRATRIVKGTTMSAEDFREQLCEKAATPCKHLYIFENDREFLKELDGKIYAISNLKGDFICDVLEEDMITLEDQNVISNGQIVSADSIEYIHSQRVEIIFLTKPTKR